MRNILLTGLWMLLATLFFSCKKDITDNPVVPPGNVLQVPVSTPVTGSLSGRVVDENNAPIEGAYVSSGTRSMMTDARGHFTFENISLDKYISTVTVTMPGYFKAYRSFSANPTRNFVDFKLLPKTLSGTFNTSSGGTITLNNSSEISLPANGIIIKNSGAAYTGSVNVYATYIDPTRNDMSAVIPGSFMARDGGNMYTLQSTGMIAVDLESDAGEPLQLAAGSPAMVKMPIPASLLDKAPNTIDTWSLDEQGVWKKEGTAPRVGDHYEMQVTHFSFWNCDVPANAVYLNLHVEDQNGNALANTMLSLTVPNNNTWWATAYGITDSMGNVSGLVPAGFVLNLAVEGSYFCSSVLYSQDIGPFTSNSTLSVTANIPPANMITVSGTAYGCGGVLLNDGLAFLDAGYNYNYTSIINGQYSFTVPYCGNLTSVEVTLINDSGTVYIQSGSVAVTGNTVIIPADTLCSSSSGNAVFSFDSMTPGGLCPQVNIAGNYNASSPLSPNNNIVTMLVNVSVPGNYSITTNSANGVVFSGSGVVTGTGLQEVYLTGDGIPGSGGNYSYFATSLLTPQTMGCAFIVPFTGTNVNAVYSLGGPGTCPNSFLSGTYITGFMTNTNHSITLMVNVTTPGDYSISSGGANNGIYFYDSGRFNVPGIQTVVIPAYGIPSSAGITTYTLQGNNTTSCSFTVNTLASGNATYSLETGPSGLCLGTTPSGTYTVGVPLTSQNTLSVELVVQNPGIYLISTTTENGISFRASGQFTVAGPQSVILTGSGTPQVSGIYNFTITGNGTCLYPLTIN